MTIIIRNCLDSPRPLLDQRRALVKVATAHKGLDIAFVFEQAILGQARWRVHPLDAFNSQRRARFEVPQVRDIHHSLQALTKVGLVLLAFFEVQVRRLTVQCWA